MKCQLCGKKEAEYIQKFDNDGIETTIAYCYKCVKEITNFHTTYINKKLLNLYSTNIFYRNSFSIKEENIELKSIKSRVFIELPVQVKRFLFVEDENSKLRDAQTIIKRGLKFWENEYEKAKKEFDEKKMKVIEDIINRIKKLM
ncbi:hypothetical protein [Marinitoga sp. 38H-ov]|uniref:hypothetical protein n=1 Tax=Marinitoga sp. 38H-ov TaxID=1755814 RepID=UPI0013EC911E|nr:hypothetical protein [Marinitoga sp. 38H-ov]KAF2955499.1 hypothetical protein AS160_09885 [Marinitoga sp. 38H-ov]